MALGGAVGATFLGTAFSWVFVWVDCGEAEGNGIGNSGAMGMDTSSTSQSLGLNL